MTTKTETKAFFSGQAKDYSSVIQYDSYVDVRKVSLVHEYIQKSDKVLDIGCADGLHLIDFSASCGAITGVDMNPDMLEASRNNIKGKKLKNCKLVEGSAEDLPLEDESFDLAFSYSTLVVVDDVAKALAEAFRVLKKGGIGVFDITGRYNLSFLHWRKHYSEKCNHEINGFSLSQARRLLKETGFQIQAEEAIGFTDQWRYIPLLHKTTFLAKVFHDGSGEPDLDARISGFVGIRCLANRWFFVVRKPF